MYSHVLFPIDLNAKQSYETSFPYVVDFAKKFGAKLSIISVIPDYGLSMVQQYFPKGWIEDLVRKSKEEIEIISQKFASGLEYDIHVETGAVYKAIIDKAEAIGANLIMIPAHRPELREYLLGPNTAKVVRHARISVLVIRDEE